MGGATPGDGKPTILSHKKKKLCINTFGLRCTPMKNESHFSTSPSLHVLLQAQVSRKSILDYRSIAETNHTPPPYPTLRAKHNQVPNHLLIPFKVANFRVRVTHRVLVFNYLEILSGHFSTSTNNSSHLSFLNCTPLGFYLM